jgi:thiol-disulfide isomerase/thioredoxin
MGDSTALPPIPFVARCTPVPPPQAPLLALYFSAAWCGPCKMFTPTLTTFYNETPRTELEIAFVSLDQNKAAFDAYYGTMPWLAADFEKCDREELAGAMGVGSIPTLIVFRPQTGEIVTLKGKEDVCNLSAADALAKWKGSH